MASESFEKLSWCDVELASVAWVSDGRDVVIRLRLWESEPPERRCRVVTCRWAQRVRVDLQMRANEGGRFLSWDGGVVALPDGRYEVGIDFAGSEIRLVCAEVVVEHTA